MEIECLNIYSYHFHRPLFLPHSGKFLLQEQIMMSEQNLLATKYIKHVNTQNIMMQISIYNNGVSWPGVLG